MTILSTRIEGGLIGWFRALRIYVPPATEHMTLVHIGPVWVQPPRWVLRKWWPEELELNND